VATEERPEGLQAWTGLCELVDAVRVVLNRQLQAEVGLTLAENLVLCQVAMAPERRLRMVDIASHLNIAKSAVTKTVDRLEHRGLLIRQSDPKDRRTVYARLSEKGIKTFAAAQPAYLHAVDEHFAGLLNRAELLNLSRASSAVLQGRQRASK
jgi:DNA-binding MarR family transcriptional regulator